MKKQFILIFVCAMFAVLFFAQASRVLGENFLSNGAINQYGFVSLGKDISLKIERKGEKIFISGSGFHPSETVRLFITAPPDSDFKNEVWLVQSDINGEINSELKDFSQNFGTNILTITAQGTNSKLAAKITMSSQNIQLTPQSDPPPGELWIVEHAAPPRDAPFNFTTTNLNPAAFSLVDNSTSNDPRQTFYVASTTRQNYTITQTDAPGYMLQDISCTYFTDSGPSPIFTRTGSTISIQMNYPNYVSCTFVNNLVTAANVSVSGRVLTANGRGIANTRVSATDENGNTRTVLTNPFGFYRFADLPTGQTYTLQAQSKRYQFTNAAQVLSVNGELSEMNFTASP